MSFLGNIIWLVTSIFVPIGYLIGGIIFFPLLPFLWPVIKYSFLPFGREIVSTEYLKSFKEKDSAESNFEKTSPTVKNFSKHSLGIEFWMDFSISTYCCRNFKCFFHLDYNSNPKHNGSF